MDNASQQARVEGAFVSASSAQHLPPAPTGRRILLRIARIGAGPADTDEVRLQKTLLVTSTLPIFPVRWPTLIGSTVVGRGIKARFGGRR